MPTLRLYFPLRGLSRTLAFRETPPLTTQLCQNVRLVDVSKERSRGGQRPGLVKAYTTQVGGAYPIIKMVSVTTTYMESS